MIRRMFLLVGLVVALVAVDTAAPTSPGEGLLAIDAAAQEDLVDLAWLAPAPADLNVDGYGLTYGVYQTAASNGVSVFGNSGPLTDYDEAFSTANPLQIYYESMALRSDDDPDITARQVTVVLAEFGDDADAETGFAAVADIFQTYDQPRTPPEVGDESLAFRGEFTGSDGRLFQELRILVRTDRFLADLVIDDYVDDAPAMSELTPLAELVVERLGDAAAAEGPALGVQVARFAGEKLTVFYDYYTRRDGDEVPIDGERASQMQIDDELFDETGTTDNYYYVADALPTDEDPTVVGLVVDFRRFTDDESAEAYLETAGEEWAEVMGSAYQDVEVVEDAEQFGDRSVTMSYVQDSTFGPLSGYRIWVHLGDRVAAVELDGDPAIPLELAEQMAEAQLACLEDEACTEPLPVSEFLQGGTGASDEETREATAEDGQDAAQEDTTEPGAAPTEATVSITSAGFDPDPVVIAAGGTVTWVNGDTSAPHGVTLLSDAGLVDQSDLLLPGVGSYSHTFTEPGTYTARDFATLTGPQGTVIVETVAAPASDATTEANQDAALEPTDETAATETYVSPSFGYSLSYDPDEWTVIEGPSSGDGIDHIALRSGPASVYLDGTTGISDAQACVESLTAYFTSLDTVAAFEPLLDEAGAPVAGGDASDYFAATRIDWIREDGTFEETLNLRCIILPTGDAALGITLRSPAALYPEAEGRLEALVEGLIFP